MFGTLKPHACGLGCQKQHEYERFYCGVCQSLGEGFGQVSRGLTSYDAVFLALVADGLVEEGAGPDRCRCPLLPVVFRPTVRPDSPAMRYASAMSVLLSDQWLADRAMDGRRAAKVARPLLAGKVQIARSILADLGISLADLDGFEERQQRVEVPGQTGPGAAAEPTASALARVFDRMALLPGVPAEGRDASARQMLAVLGRRLGSAIYLIDALDDLEKDHLGGAFNPCLLPDGEVSWARVEETWALLRDDLAALADLSPALPLRRHRELVHGVIGVELRRQAQAAARRAHAYARSAHARRTAARLREHWARRALAAAATVFVLFWVWLSSFPALAVGPKRPSSPPRRPGTAAPSSSAPPEHWDPTLPAPTAPPDGGAPDSGAPATHGGGADPTEHSATDTAPPAPSGQPGPPGGGSPCPCNGVCDNFCGTFAKSCSSSCGKCASPDCSCCSKPCESCGSCTNCGSCCNGCNCNQCCSR